MALSSARKQDASHLDREFPMSQANFDKIADIAYRLTGIKLSDHKKNMIYSRISRRIRERQLSCFDDYCKLISLPGNDEITNFVNAITTNLTSFFREEHHFEYLQKTVFPLLLKQNSGNKRIRIWSAGCSTGEEPYTLAICAREKLPVERWDVKILATDLDTNVVEHGKNGVYDADRIEDLAANRKKKWFLKDRGGDQVRVKPELQKLIRFRQLNLLHDWPMQGKFDVIFCRNVVIYFDKETQKKLFARYAKMLNPGGHLFIGHSESLHKVSTEFTSLGQTIYRRVD